MTELLQSALPYKYVVVVNMKQSPLWRRKLAFASPARFYQPACRTCLSKYWL